MVKVINDRKWLLWITLEPIFILLSSIFRQKKSASVTNQNTTDTIDNGPSLMKIYIDWRQSTKNSIIRKNVLKSPSVQTNKLQNSVINKGTCDKGQRNMWKMAALLTGIRKGWEKSMSMLCL